MLSCQLISSKEYQIIKNVSNVVLPGYLGELQILPGHAESFILLRKGNILIETKKLSNKIPIEKGLAFVNDNKIIIIY
jgi:F0F1-type ATP synthase epsilon subunit